jgi:hypothetical protein
VQILQSATDALARAKQEGRNRTEIGMPSAPQTPAPLRVAS